jgi:hypothetical protein
MLARNVTFQIFSVNMQHSQNFHISGESRLASPVTVRRTLVPSIAAYSLSGSGDGGSGSVGHRGQPRLTTVQYQHAKAAELGLWLLESLHRSLTAGLH